MVKILSLFPPITIILIILRSLQRDQESRKAIVGTVITDGQETSRVIREAK